MTEEQAAAHDRYVGQYGSARINQYLRNADFMGKPVPDDVAWGAETRSDVAQLDAAMAAHQTKKPVLVFRGLGVSPETLGAVPGAVIGDPGFVSTSVRADVAEGAAKSWELHHGGTRNPDEKLRPATLIKLTVPAGTHALKGNEREAELLIARGAQYRVTKVTPGSRHLAPIANPKPGSYFTHEVVGDLPTIEAELIGTGLVTAR